MRDLQTLRCELDGIDREIVALFARRMAVCDEVADYKAAHGLSVPDASREKEKLSSVRAQCEIDLADDAAELFEKLMALSRARQVRRMEKKK